MKTIFSCLMALLLPLLAGAQDPQAMARTSIKQEGEIWLGQKVVMVVELMVPGYFAGSASYTLPKVAGVLIVPPVGSPMVSTEDIGGVSYTVQRHELMLFSQVEGDVTVPTCEIRLEYKRSPLDHDAVQQAVKTQAVTFKVARPPGTQPGQVVITSSDLKVEELWKPEPGTNAKVGDAFARTLQWTAGDVTGMAFPPFRTAPIRGLGIYPSDPVVEDSSPRGSLHGERTDKVTYVCKSGGHFEIPPLSVTWWNPESKELKKIAFKAHAFDVPMPPAPPVTLRMRLASLWRDYGPWIIGASGGIMAVALILHFFKAECTSFARRFLPRHLPSLNP